MREGIVKDKGWKLLVRMFKEAKKDGIITFDEGRILQVTDWNVSKLIEYVKTAWEDRNLTEQEKQKITFLLKKMSDDANRLARYDEIITPEEESLLQIIADIISEILSHQS